MRSLLSFILGAGLALAFAFVLPSLTRARKPSATTWMLNAHEARDSRAWRIGPDGTKKADWTSSTPQTPCTKALVGHRGGWVLWEDYDCDGRADSMHSIDGTYILVDGDPIGPVGVGKISSIKDGCSASGFTFRWEDDRWVRQAKGGSEPQRRANPPPPGAPEGGSR